MTPAEVQTINSLLMNRVVPQSAREGLAIAQLAAKLVSHFAQPTLPTENPPHVNKGGEPGGAST